MEKQKKNYLFLKNKLNPNQLPEVFTQDKSLTNLLSLFYKKFKVIAMYNKLIQHKVSIRINANNTMVSLVNLNGHLVHSLTAGKIGLNSTKRNYKQVSLLVLNQFFKYLQDKEIKNNLHFKIIAPAVLRNKLLTDIILPQMNNNKYMIEILRMLPFNGCRPPKKRRKKRQGLRVFKT